MSVRDICISVRDICTHDLYRDMAIHSTYGKLIPPSAILHAHRSPVTYEGESISNRPNLFPVDRDGHDFHALFQYMFYTWVQNYTRIKSFFNKILNVKHG